MHWSDSGELAAIATDDTIYILKYNPDKVAQAMENKDEISEDGVEEAFDVWTVASRLFSFNQALVFIHYTTSSIVLLHYLSQVVGEIEDVVKTGLWVGDCFIYTNSGKLYCIMTLYTERVSVDCNLCL